MRAATAGDGGEQESGEFLDYLENQSGGGGEHGSGAKRNDGADVRRAVGVEARASA